MDLATREALAAGKAVVITRRGTFVSKHDKVEAAMDAMLSDRRENLHVLGPLKPEECAKHLAHIDKLKERVAIQRRLDAEAKAAAEAEAEPQEEPV